MHDPTKQAPPGYGQDPGYGQHPGQHYGMPPVVEEDDSWGKVGIVMVALAVVFAGGVAYFIATSGGVESSDPSLAAAEAAGEASAEPAQPADPDPGAASEPAALSDPDPESDAGPGSEPEPIADAGPGPEPASDTGLLRANGEIDRPAGLISLSIESEPAGATVIRKRDGVRLGITPYRYEVEGAPGSISFVLELDGYRSTSLKFPADQDSVRQVMLLPGKGGAVIPAPAVDEPRTAKTVAEAPKTEAPKTTSAPRAAKRKKPRRAPKPRNKKKKKRERKKRKKKPAGGTVDYSADPIPL